MSGFRYNPAMAFVQKVLTGLFISMFCACLCGAQTPTTSILGIESYPENTGGLKQLVKDIMNAQKAGDAARADALLNSFVIPDAEKWYVANFDDGATSRVLEKYLDGQKDLSKELARFFLVSQAEGFKDVEVVRFEKNCDDYASEQTFNTLDARLSPFALYEIRLLNGTRFRRLFAFAYIDGGFRFVLTPDFSQPAVPKTSTPGIGTDGLQKVLRIKQDGPVTATSLVKRIQPQYPEVAKAEGLAGTVRLNAIIDKEGKIKELRVISGRCSLARASIDAVRKWRYRPTLLNGEPVEVDTTVDVIFTYVR